MYFGEFDQTLSGIFMMNFFRVGSSEHHQRFPKRSFFCTMNYFNHLESSSISYMFLNHLKQCFIIIACRGIILAAFSSSKSSGHENMRCDGLPIHRRGKLHDIHCSLSHSYCKRTLFLSPGLPSMGTSPTYNICWDV